MILAGILGLVAAMVGWKLSIHQPAPFVGYWYLVAAVVLIGAFAMVRRQAWQQAEPIWSPPTRRVAQAMLSAAGRRICPRLADGRGRQVTHRSR